MNGGHGGFLQFHWRDVSISAAHPRHRTRENSLVATENYNHPFIAIEKNDLSFIAIDLCFPLPWLPFRQFHA